MNNVKTNRTLEQAFHAQKETLSLGPFTVGWRSCLESVVQEPALTMDEIDIRDMITDAAFEAMGSSWEREIGIDGLLGLASKVLAARIPAPATVEATHLVGPAALPSQTASTSTPAPQEGDVLRDWLRGGHVSELFADIILTRHQQALSAREQAVRAEEQKRFDGMEALYDASDRHVLDLIARLDSIRAELAAEKLANEGKYAIGERSEQLVEGRGWVLSVIESSTYDERFNSGYVNTSNPAEVRHVSTLTPAEKAEVWVKWYCEVGEKAARYSEFDAWKYLATRQANGETIDQIYAGVEGRRG